jgi:hypothetical protein
VTWLAWRQLRTQAAVVYGALAVLAVVLVVTGAQLADLSDTSGSALLERLASGGAKGTVYFLGSAAVLALPAIIGVFWGAPLVARELEAGTHRLVWTQTVTRSRWLATKVALTGLAAMAAAALLGLVMTWWAGPIQGAIESGQAANGIFGVSRMSPWMFDARGIAPLGHTAFALALGVTAGLVIRRTVPAMAVTLAVFVAVQIATPVVVRSNLGPAELTTAITHENLRGLMMSGPPPGGPVVELSIELGKPGAWVIANETLDAEGRVAGTLPSWVGDCGGPPGVERLEAQQEACFARLADAGYRQRVTYQANGRYWALQAYETAIFLALALGLIGFCFWWLRRRLS